jgi:hypothetical protein
VRKASFAWILIALTAIGCSTAPSATSAPMTTPSPSATQGALPVASSISVRTSSPYMNVFPGASGDCVYPDFADGTAYDAAPVSLTIHTGQVILLAFVVSEIDVTDVFPWLPTKSSDESVLEPLQICPDGPRVYSVPIRDEAFIGKSTGSADLTAALDPRWLPLPGSRGRQSDLSDFDLSVSVIGADGSTADVPGAMTADEAATLLSRCPPSPGKIHAYFKVPPGKQVADYLPSAMLEPYLVGPSGSLVVVYDDPLPATLAPDADTSHGVVVRGVCVVPPTGTANVYGDAYRTGMILPPGARLGP